MHHLLSSAPRTALPRPWHCLGGRATAQALTHPALLFLLSFSVLLLLLSLVSISPHKSTKIASREKRKEKGKNSKKIAKIPKKFTCVSG